MMNMNIPYVKVYDDVFSEDDCGLLISLFESAKSELDIVEGHRFFRVVDTTLNDAFDDVRDAVVNKFIEVIKQYCDDCGVKEYQWPDEVRFEDFRMKKYDAGYGQFSPHVDVNNLHDNRRFLVFFLYLNDVEEGGETSFTDYGVKVKAKRGRVLIFPPTWTYPHAGEMPISGDKYIIGGYLHYNSCN